MECVEMSMVETVKADSENPKGADGNTSTPATEGEPVPIPKAENGEEGIEVGSRDTSETQAPGDSEKSAPGTVVASSGGAPSDAEDTVLRNSDDRFSGDKPSMKKCPEVACTAQNEITTSPDIENEKEQRTMTENEAKKSKDTKEIDNQAKQKRKPEAKNGETAKKTQDRGDEKPKEEIKKPEEDIVKVSSIVDGHYKARDNLYRRAIRTISEGRESLQEKTENGCCQFRMKRSPSTHSDVYQVSTAHAKDEPNKPVVVVEMTDDQNHSKPGDTDKDAFDVCHKVVLLGDTNVGKTSLIKYLSGESFDPTERSTIAIDFATKMFNVDGARVKLHIWDMPGQERFATPVRNYYKDTKGVVLVYDVTDYETFVFLHEKWLHLIDKEIDHYRHEPVPVYVAGNKVDVEKEMNVTETQGREFVEQNNCRGFFSVSAKVGTNVKQLFEQVAYAVTDTYTPKIMDSYLSPKELDEKYARQASDRPSELGTISVVDSDLEREDSKTETRQPAQWWRCLCLCGRNKT